MAIPFTRPDITRDEIDAVVAVLRSGWLTTGPVTTQFEQALVQYTGAQGAVCVSSATAGLELALQLCGAGPGDEVIVPAYTFSATAAAVVHVGAVPVLADCEPGRFHLGADRVEALLTERTAAVIPVDLGGVPCDYDAIRAACCMAPPRRRRGVGEILSRPVVIADAAHSLGAQTGGRKSGALADLSVFSFHAAKNLTTAEGGAVLWNIPGIDSDATHADLSRLMLHGQDKTAWQRKTGAVEYDILSCGFKANLTDLQSAIGLSQLSRYAGMLARRRAVIEAYDGALPAGWESLAHGEGSACHLYLALLPEARRQQRDGLLARLGGRGIGCNIHYRPLPLMTAYRRLGWRGEDFPHAVALYRRELSLPLSSLMSPDDALFVADLLN
jgi:dTDP-4-amino-4,6-dideoxygalactose transaminase